MRGNLFENMVVLEIVKEFLNQGKDPELYFYRDSNMNEIDLIIKNASELVPIEIKSSMTFNDHFLKNLKYFKKISKQSREKEFLIYSGRIEQGIGSTEVMNFKNIHSKLKQYFS